MSGHSKFSNIKHRKGAQDAKRAKLFVKISKEIAIAVQKGGSDLKSNAALRMCIAKARASNMPKSNYMKAIEKSNKLDKNHYEENTYEGYLKGGAAIIVSCLTDNRNRTSANIRNYFNKCGASLGQTNSVSYMFSRLGLIVFNKDNYEVDDLLEYLNFNVVDLEYDSESNTIVIKTEPNKLEQTKELLNKKNIEEFLICESRLIANDKIGLSNENQKKLNKLIDLLDDDEDVTAYYYNCS